MDHHANPIVAQVKHVDAVGSVVFDHLRSRPARRGVNHVGLHGPKVDREFGQVIEHGSDALRTEVIFFQTLDVMVESVEARRCEESGLTPTTSEQFSPAVRLGDEGRRTDQDGAHGRTEPFGEADRNGVVVLAHACHVHTCGNRSVENSRPVNVSGTAQRRGDRCDFIQGCLIVARAAPEVGGVFDTDERPVWIVAARTLGLANSRFDLFGGHQSALAVNECNGCAAQRCVTPAFVAIDVSGFVAHDFIAGDGVGAQCDGV